MGDDRKTLRMNWRGQYVDINVEVDKCTLLDVVIEYEVEGKKQGIRMDYHFPTFAYSYKMESHTLVVDKDLMKMFERLSEKELINIWVGTTLKPNALYKLVLNLKRKNECNKVVAHNEVVDDIPGLEDLEDTSVDCVRPKPKPKPKPKPMSKPKPVPKSKVKSKASTMTLPPPPVSPKSAFLYLPIRRSPTFSPPQTVPVTTTTTAPPTTDHFLFNRKIPKTTARRKGVCTESVTVAATTESVVDMGQTSSENSLINARRRVEFTQEFTQEEDTLINAEDVDSDEEPLHLSDFEDVDSDEEVKPTGDVYADENEEIQKLPKVKDNWKPSQWHDFIDDDNDDDYYQTLYRNGEMYEDKAFGKIVLRPWMIFMDKSHFKDTLKDYCVQEGFAITVISADSKRYTATCYAACCGWRIHASRLADGITWAIKKIDPNVHSCRGLEIYNPICNVKWAASKLMEDIRANPDIPGKALNELLFQRYGLYMKQSTLYTMKKFAVDKLFGGHDESYSHLPAYTKIITETNPDSKAFCAFVETESIPRQMLFDTIFISFSAMWKGFLRGCRPLIGVDGTHLKGNYGGILLSAVAVDGNNEIFPLAYAVVSVEDKDNWAFFLWNIYHILKDSSRQDWTIISDRQKGIDLALEKVWPTAKRRYCCRHLSRNYKKLFSGPLMYTLFWRACNATSQFTYRKAMERLQKAGGEEVMTWFAELGDQSTWSKHKFDPNVCNDSNTSNFVESFNATLGVDRCRPVLTLLEGIRRVCMVRIATRQQIAMTWNDDDLCPKIVKAVKDISKGTISCKAYMSKPGEYEIHEGKSQFPLSLNTKLCSCGAWQLSGIPCRHAIRAMLHAKVDPHTVVSSWYSVRTYKQAYGFNINPIPDNESWPTYDRLPTIMPPVLKRGVGRPCRNRKREAGEAEKGKRSKTVKCTKCGNFGHNSRTCKGGPTQKEIKAAVPKLIRNPRVRDQSKAAKAARASAKDVSKATEKATAGKRKATTQGSASQPSVLTESQQN